MKKLDIEFEGGTVLITGAATGIGRATALASAAARAAVAIARTRKPRQVTSSRAAARPCFRRSTYPTAIRSRPSSHERFLSSAE
jgi:NAD(P)-dependent dehydrogenase (short-subunit alcohol dehydrogenase family)